VIIDEVSMNPGEQLLEKEVSGAYLYRHYNLYACQLDLKKDIKSTIHLNTLAINNGSEGALAQAIFERSASLAAAEIAAIYDFRQQKHLVFLIEGTLFWNGWKYREMVYDYLSRLGLALGQVQIKKIEKSYILGAAQLLFS
jgi:hexokinase